MSENKPGDSYTFYGPVGAAGADSKAENFQQIQLGPALADPSTSARLLQELSRVRAAAQAGPASPGQLESLAEAEDAIRGRDESKFLGAVKKGGAWLLDLATRVGAALLAEMVKRHVMPTP
jgi:hypothetical protein